MVHVIEMSPENEMPVANKLAAEIRRAWPDVAKSPTEHVTILVGIKVRVEIDLLVVVRLQTPRPVPAMMRRDGTMSAPDYVQGAVLLIEVKQLPPECFTVVGTEIFPVRAGKRDRQSVSHQATSGSHALRTFWCQYGYEGGGIAGSLETSMANLPALGWAWLSSGDAPRVHDGHPATVEIRRIAGRKRRTA
jgi:hypothetical protein